MRIALLVALLLASAPDAHAEHAAIRRFALIVGMNDGGKSRPELRYATDDAVRMSNVLEELGGVSEFDRTVLLTSDRAQLESALTALKAQVAAARNPKTLRQLVFYYSGHSDGEGLLLGKEHVSYGELRKMIRDVGADIHIAILDSCASGALVRTKGGKPRPPFLQDESTDVRGHVFLTSSSEDEVAQESDRIGGSFFTHFLISGLRGAADTSHDGKVTFNEAYQYAFDETLERTEKTSAGAQHASYDIQLAGSGDLVITDLRESSVRLSFGNDLEGRFYVRDQNGHLVAELYKPRGRAAQLGLEPGTYHITQETDTGLRAATLHVERGDSPSLTSLEPTEGEVAVARGGKEEPPYFPIALSLLPVVSTTGLNRITTNFAIDAAWGSYANVFGAHISAAIGQVEDSVYGVQITGAVGLIGNELLGAQISGVYNQAGDAEGVQIAVVNVADWIKGAQIGVVNVTGDGRGTQIGLVNIADHFEGFRLGLANISSDTVYRFSGYTGEANPFELGFRMQDGPIYTLFTAGAGNFSKEGQWTLGFGLGGEIEFAPFFLDIDLVAMSVHKSRKFETEQMVPIRLRAVFGWRIFSHLAIIAGVTGNLAIDFSGEDRAATYAPGWAKRASDEVTLWPGFVAGIEI